MSESFFRPVADAPSSQPLVRPSGGGGKGDRMYIDRRVKVEPEVKKQKRMNGWHGCLFKVEEYGWFDEHAFWCVRKANRGVEVSRNAPRKIVAMLSKEQKAKLHYARARAIKLGVR